MDWTSAGDMHKRFKLFKQKCNLVFDGPLSAKGEVYKVRVLLLWAGDKGLEIHSTSRFNEDADKLKVEPVLGAFDPCQSPIVTPQTTGAHFWSGLYIHTQSVYNSQYNYTIQTIPTKPFTPPAGTILTMIEKYSDLQYSFAYCRYYKLIS